jgi:hypothetical protein
MHPAKIKTLRQTMAHMQPMDVPVLHAFVPGHEGSIVLELTQAQYMNAMCAIINTPDGAPTPDLYDIEADGEVLSIPAHGIFHAFAIARTLRPHAIVVSDTK